jgi:hypothetical protein
MAGSGGSDGSTRVLRLRRADTCVSCRAYLGAGTEAQWDRPRRAVTCLTCAGIAVTGIAGGSATRQAARRRERQRARQQAAKAAHPVLGRIRLALFPERDAGLSYASGAKGEQVLARFLDGLGDKGILTLHDRRLPGSSANIDHLVVAPSGVWVIDAKRYKGKRVERAWGVLKVGGRDGTKLVQGVHKQIEHVRLALTKASLTDVPLNGALCFIEADIGLLQRPFTVDGVTVTWRRALGKRLVEPGPLDEEARAHVRQAVAGAFRPAS